LIKPVFTMLGIEMEGGFPLCVRIRRSRGLIY